MNRKQSIKSFKKSTTLHFFATMNSFAEFCSDRRRQIISELRIYLATFDSFILFTANCMFHNYNTRTKDDFHTVFWNSPWIEINEKSLRETQTLRAACSKAEPKIFATPQTHFPGAQDRQNLISWRWSLPAPTDPLW